ncbi:MAG: hypothetical protein AWU57_943 [Marinobacter sp. T13-3]|nr:MAG: hypothetical protein AWU57_943 [Marinobacter sp. T13-3]
MAQEHDIELLKAVRISRAIEMAGVLVSIGLTLLAIAIANGWPQIVIGIFGAYWIINMIREGASYQEFRHYGLFEPKTTRELKAENGKIAGENDGKSTQ